MSRWDRVIDLVDVSYGQNAYGAQEASESTRRVFANELSIGADSFYAAAQSGHSIVARYELRSCDYKGERIAYVGDKRLAVTRVQSHGADFVRIDLEEEAGERWA